MGKGYGKDGKDKFYRSLNLDKKTRVLLKEYKLLKIKMMKDPEIVEVEDVQTDNNK